MNIIEIIILTPFYIMGIIIILIMWIICIYFILKILSIIPIIDKFLKWVENLFT